MTAKYKTQRETVDLLERILARVESIDTHVEDIRDQIDDRLSGFIYRDEYDEPTDDETSYR